VSRLALEVAATVLLMGAVPVIIRHVTADVVTIGILRLVVASACLGAWLGARRTPLALPRRDWRALAVMGTVFAFHWLLYFLGIKMSSASVAAIGASTFGIHLIVLGWVIGHHRVRALDVAAVALAVAGTLLVVPEWGADGRATQGLLLAVVSAFLYAILPILHQRHAHMPSRVRAFGQFVFALPLFLVLSPWSSWDLPAADWIWLAVLTVGSTFVAHTLWTHLSTVLPTMTTSVVFYLYVPVSLALGAAALGEQITRPMLAGAALIIGGNLLALAALPPRASSALHLKPESSRDD
jgi:drug/metabolite transporter (DMT)-like permease